MSFVYDAGALPDGKSDARPLEGLAAQAVVAAEWNTVMQSIYDCRTALISADYFGLLENEATVSDAGKTKLRMFNSMLQASVDGGAYRKISPPAGIIDVEELGIHPDNTAEENTDAIEAALAAVESDPPAIRAGTYWQFGKGNFYFDTGITVVHPCFTLAGMSGTFNHGATRFEFPAESDGIILTNTAYGSRVTGIVVEGTNHTAGTAHNGITLCGSSQIVDRCVVLEFPNHGIFINGFSSDPQFNFPDLCKLTNIRLENNGNCGLRVGGTGGYGEDANQCLIQGVDATSNGIDPDTGNFTDEYDRFGISDGSALGNIYVGCHTAANGLMGDELGGAYCTFTGSNMSQLVGCYSEAGQMPSKFVAGKTDVHGGDHGAGIDDVQCGCQLKQGEVYPSLEFPDVKGFGRMSLGCGNDAIGRAFEFQGDGEESEIGLSWNKVPSAFSNIYGWNRANGANLARGITGDNSVDIYWPMKLDPTHTVFPFTGFKLGNIAVMQTRDGEPPDTDSHSSGATFNAGDLCLFTGKTPGVVLAGRPSATRCTVSGTIGTYAEGRTATATGVPTVTLDSPTAGALSVGQVLTINGVRARIDSLSGTTMVMSENITAGGPGLAIAYAAPTWSKCMPLDGGGDSTGAAGDAEINQIRGKSKIGIGDGAITITNNQCVTGSHIFLTLVGTPDATLTSVHVENITNGTFDIVGNDTATAAVTVHWKVEN